jgi:methyl-accepting chemotaxis protein
MSHAAQESAQGASQVNESASSPAEIAEELNRNIARFKV